MPQSFQADWTDSLLERAGDVTRRYQAAGYFPTASVRVFDREGTLAHFTVGDAREDTLFDVASLTKIATGTMVLMEIDRGNIALQAPIGTYFGEIRDDAYLSGRLKDVTVFQLLTHTSTLVDWYPFYVQKGKDFFAALKIALQTTKPTVGMVYSDLNFMLLGKLIERVSGLPLDEALQALLVKPLGLGNMLYRPDPKRDIVPTGFGNPTEVGMCAERNLAFNAFRPESEPVRVGTHDGNAYYYFDDVAGHAGIFAAPLAYERLCRFYMNTERPIFLDAQKEHAPTRGLALQMGPMYPYGCGHTGFTGTSIWFSREKNIGAIAFTNRLYYKGFLNEHMTGDYRRALHETVLTLAETLR